jgi:hypothetical protein
MQSCSIHEQCHSHKATSHGAQQSSGQQILSNQQLSPKNHDSPSFLCLDFMVVMIITVLQNAARDHRVHALFKLGIGIAADIPIS